MCGLVCQPHESRDLCWSLLSAPWRVCVVSEDRLQYPPAVAELLAQMPLAPLGPGTPVVAVRPRIAALAGTIPPTCLAGLWLAFHFLDESHTLSQDLPSVEGSYWHGILHRREPDAANAAYWFRRVGRHPIFEPLRHRAAELGYAVKGHTWDPFAFIEACEAHRGKGNAEEERLRQVQQAEWELLFAWCFQR